VVGNVNTRNDSNTQETMISLISKAQSASQNATGLVSKSTDAYKTFIDSDTAPAPGIYVRQVKSVLDALKNSRDGLQESINAREQLLKHLKTITESLETSLEADRDSHSTVTCKK
jgi:hypothetical protein